MTTAASIDVPVAPKVPLKVNAYEMARQGNSQLLPLFPYLGPGDIVPCVAAFRSDGKGTHIGYFVHHNVVDEVGLSLGSTGRLRSGDMFVGHKSHGVGGDTDQPYFAVLVITQRQLDEGEQPEGMTFQCEKCATELYRYDFEGGVGEGQGKGKEAPNNLTPLPSLEGSFASTVALNSSEKLRTCTSCGHVNQPFPLHIWGWGSYMFRTGIAIDARRALVEAARS